MGAAEQSLEPKRHDGPPKVAVVLSGAVARGAFQAGALGAVLTALEAEHHLTPSILLGASAGSINAVLWADAMRALGPHPDPEVVAKTVHDIWVSMGADDVYTPPLSWWPPDQWRSFRRLGWPAIKGFWRDGIGPASLLDTAPLQERARQILPDPLVLADGLEAVGVVATWVPPTATNGSASGRSTVFLQQRAPTTWDGDATRALDVEPCELGPAHVLASCAVPVGFPAHHLVGGRPGWYVDGGVRLNTPLLPAVALDATHIVVISALSLCYADPGPGGNRPAMIDATSQVMHALVADRAVEDLLALERTNRMIERAKGSVTFHARSGREYRPVQVLVVAPEPGELRRLARERWDTKYRSPSALARLETNAVLGRLLRATGGGASWDELLSYVLFDDDYFEASYQHGVEAARTVLSRPDESLWRTTDVLGPLCHTSPESGDHGE